jgi:sensor histidine kinase YesM
MVKDNGPGLGANSSFAKNGVGLANTAERLEKMYGSERRLLLENRPEGGLQATLTLPLRFAAQSERISKEEQPRMNANKRE